MSTVYLSFIYLSIYLSVYLSIYHVAFFCALAARPGSPPSEVRAAVCAALAMSASVLADATELLKIHGLVPEGAGPAPAAPPTPPPREAKRRYREDLVLDTACGEDGWQIEEREVTTDFIEEDGTSWSCCVSMVVSLSWGGSVHEETGTGTAEGERDAAAATAAARQRARTSGMKRLAKRFASCLGQDALRAIERQLHAERGGASAAPAAKAWRPR